MKQISVLKKRNSFFSYLLISLLFVCLTASGVYAGSGSSVPNTFSSGDTAVSSEVNANFSYFLDRCWDVNGNDLYYKDGNIAIGTDSTNVELTMYDSSSEVWMRMASGSSSIESWNIGVASEGLRFHNGDDSKDYLVIDQDGDVGLGTSSPSYNLHVYDSGNLSSYFDANGTVDVVLKSESQAGLSIKSNTNPVLSFQVGTTNPGSTRASLYISSSDYSMRFQAGGETDRMTLDSSGNLGIGTTSPNGKLDVNGTIYQRGSSLHADYVFEDNYQLESIDEHADYMWNNKHLKAVPKAKKDENGLDIVEVGSHQKGILEELEKAHIYISQLNDVIKKQQEAIETMQQGYQKTISDLSEAVDVLKEKINQ